jgi:hypothetical protein
MLGMTQAMLRLNWTIDCTKRREFARFHGVADRVSRAFAPLHFCRLVLRAEVLMDRSAEHIATCKGLDSLRTQDSGFEASHMYQPNSEKYHEYSI